MMNVKEKNFARQTKGVKSRKIRTDGVGGDPVCTILPACMVKSRKIRMDDVGDLSWLGCWDNSKCSVFCDNNGAKV